MQAPTEMIKGNAEALILSCLEREPMHGYRIVKELAEVSEGYFNLREGTLYPHLHRLERDGLIEGNWESTGSRDRKCYRITDRGKSVLAAKREEWKEFQSNVSRVLGMSPAT